LRKRRILRALSLDWLAMMLSRWCWLALGLVAGGRLRTIGEALRELVRSKRPPSNRALTVRPLAELGPPPAVACVVAVDMITCKVT